MLGDTQHLCRDSGHPASLDQPDGFQLEFQRVPRPSFRFAHFFLLKLILTHQLRSTFFGGKVKPSGIEGALQHCMRLEKRAVVRVLDKLIKGATFVARDTADMRQGVVAVETYAARVSVDGAEYVARIVVREVQDGRRFYDHVAFVNRKRKARQLLRGIGSRVWQPSV
ncbi:hypothetical protein [Acidovorax sp.]|uniref:LPD3 domain-containing protein n=1 Tax=Acidovorax sp. TaxID=1872122 RepID=UPI00391F8144